MEDIERQEMEGFVLTAFNHLEAEKKAVFLDFLGLGLKYPEFVDAFWALTPPGANCPPWEAVRSLVAKWNAKGRPNGAA